MRNCITHHHACDCREEKFRKLEAAMAEAKRGFSEIRKYNGDTTRVRAEVEVALSKIEQIMEEK